MSNFLDELVGDAVTLVESELPSPAQIRTVLGALIKRVDRLEQKTLGTAATPVRQLQDQVAADVAAAVAPTPVAPVDELKQERDRKITALRAQLAALEGGAG